jgi:hypothetical protein
MTTLAQTRRDQASEIPAIYRIARVLEPQAWAALGTGDTLAYKNRRTSSLRKARAALEAIMEPTDAMLRRGSAAAEVCDDGWESNATWMAMINAAVEEQ